MTVLDAKPVTFNDAPAATSAPVENSATSAPDARGRLLTRVARLLDGAGIPLVLLHGYEQFPQHVGGDVDCLVPPEHLPHALARLLGKSETELNARVVQWIDDGNAHFIVLAGRNGNGEPYMLQLHASSDYRFARRVFYAADEILASKRRHGDFWTPAPEIEFGCVLVNRIAKAKLEEKHARRLTALFAESPAGARRQIERFFPDASAANIATAAQSGEWSGVQAMLPSLREQLLSGVRSKQRGAIVGRAIGEWARRVSRWLSPKWGMHVVFLGPDGVGKSTVIDAVREHVSPAFLRTDYQTFAPSLIPEKLQTKKESPHALPPRSYPASLVKAAWWMFCYTALYFVTIHPTRARGGIVLNHRYLLDAIVDRKRYRYSGPEVLLRAIWRIAPKPDAIVLLDAPTDVIHARKREVTLEEVGRQRAAYRSLIFPLSFGHIVDAGQPVKDTIADVDEIILGIMRKRIADRFK